MGKTRNALLAGSILVAGLTGWMIAPTFARAAQTTSTKSLVSIVDAQSGVTAGVLGNGWLAVATRPAGRDTTLVTLDNDQPDVTSGDSWVVSSIVLDGSVTTTDPVQVTVSYTDSGCPQCGSNEVWRGTVEPGGHVTDTFPAGLNLNGSGGNVYDVTFSAPDSGAQLEIFGRVGE